MHRVLEVKLLPPVLPNVLIPRARLEARLAEASTRRLTSVVAPAGFGKSTALAVLADQHRCAWYTLTPEDWDVPSVFQGIVGALRLHVAALGSDVLANVSDLTRGPSTSTSDAAQAEAHAMFLSLLLEEHLTVDLVLVLDDVHEVAPGIPAAVFIEALCRHAPRVLHLVLSSREEPPFAISRLRARGQVVDITSADLVFTETETAELVAGLGGREDVISAVHAVTGGWPAAVRLAAEALRGRPELVAGIGTRGLVSPGGPVFALLAEEVMGQLDPQVAELLGLVAPLGRFTAGLLEEALHVGHARQTLLDLEQRGLFLTPHGGGEPWYSLHPLAREFAEDKLALDPAVYRRNQLAAAAWLETHGHLSDALHCLEAAGDHPSIQRVLHDHGTVLVGSGGADQVVRLVSELAPELRSPAIDQLEGDACQARGDWDGALECFNRLARESPLTVGLAWRIGLIHHQHGDLDRALEVYEKGLGVADDGPDRALLLAWAAAAHWLRGSLDTCRKYSEEAFELARRRGDDKALAAAHTALAMLAAVDGDRRANDAHYLHALRYAERAGDSLQIIRIRCNRGSRLLEEGHYVQAITELDEAIRVGDLTGFTTFVALARTNRGQALLGLGRLEEAADELNVARTTYECLGSRNVAYPLVQLAELHWVRGQVEQARGAFEEAIRLSEPVNDVQVLVSALTGLARVIAGENPDEARRLADRAVAMGPTLGRPHALAMAGWAAVRCGDTDRARLRAVEASATARAQRDRAALAEALMLEALVASAPARTRARLEEARDLWRELQSPLGEARAELAIASLLPSSEAARLVARVERRLRRIGARADAMAVTQLGTSLSLEAPPPISLLVLGGFRVLRHGVAIPPGDWPSRKARDLLKILVARRGGPVHRENLIELLWPDEDPDRTASKLSVALSSVRAVLDPGKSYDSDHFLLADRTCIALNAENIYVDVDSFMVAASAALRLRTEGRGEAHDALIEAEAIYLGDAFEDDPYEEWALGVREEARTLYISVARALAEDAVRSGDTDGAARLLFRLLERDPYDERAHLTLVASLSAGGRHGDARRMFRAYCARMNELEVEPAAFPGTAQPVCV